MRFPEVTAEAQVVPRSAVTDRARHSRGATAPDKALAVLRETVGTQLDAECFAARCRVVARVGVIEDDGVTERFSLPPRRPSISA